LAGAVELPPVDITNGLELDGGAVASETARKATTRRHR
jgi:hypothetical protein